jgi:hypothetical protein
MPVAAHEALRVGYNVNENEQRGVGNSHGNLLSSLTASVRIYGPGRSATPGSARIPQTYLRFLVGAFFADFDLAFAAFATGFFPKSPSSQP